MGLFSYFVNTLGDAVTNTVGSLSFAIKTTISGPSPEYVQGVKDSMAFGEDEQQRFFASHPNAQMADYYAYLAGKTVTQVFNPPSGTGGTASTGGIDIKQIGMIALIAIVVMKIIR
jgi:hypothetical protein